jgi:hypothetical protein
VSEAEIAYRERKTREDNLINILSEIQWKTNDKEYQDQPDSNKKTPL